MPGDFTLGCLLGQYDRAQSFDVASAAAIPSVGSWQVSNVVSCFYGGSAPTQAHSSAQGLRIDVFSRGSVTALLEYDYDAANDAFARWFPDITSHLIQVDIWGRESSSTNRYFMDFNGAPRAPIIPGTNLANVRLSTTVISGSTPRVRLVVSGGTAAATAWIDDALTQTDLITLNPTYDFTAAQRTVTERARSRGGVYYDYTWGRYEAWTVPLAFLSNSYADLITWWWENNFRLLFTLDTSDTTQMFITQIVNDTQPIGKILSPYPFGGAGWTGVLQLETIDQGSLVF